MDVFVFFIQLVYHRYMAVIKVQNIEKSFGEKKLLDGISFSLAEGERVSLLGPGGCGKSTVLKIILNLITADQGEIEIFGQNLAELPEEGKRELLKKVGMAFQQGALFDFMTVEENLEFAAENMTKLSAIERKDKIKTLLEGVKMPQSATQFPYELSGGMQRRVGIARALVTDPQVALFDEPTSGLDPVTSTIILNMIMELSSKMLSGSQIIATSNVEIAMRFAERILILNEGKIVADGAWSELLVSGPAWVKKFLSVRLIGLDLAYANELKLPEAFIKEHWH